MRTKVPTAGNNLPARRTTPGPKSSCPEDELDVVISLVGEFGARNQDIADYFGVSIKTVEGWIRNKPEFAEAVRRGRVLKGLKVAESLYKRATGFTYFETIVSNRTIKEYNEQGKPLRTIIEPVEIQVEKTVHPEAWAAHKVLSILHREIWADSTNVNVDHRHSGDINLRRIEELSMDNISEEIREAIFDLSLQQISDGQHN